MKCNRTLFALLLAVMGVIAAQPAHAALCGTGLNPLLVSATPMSFGLYSPGAGSPTTATGTVTVSCTVTVTDTLPSFAVALSAGLWGSFSARKMDFAGTRLNYNLYTTGAYTTVWGDGTGGTATAAYDSSASLGSINFTVYGAVPASQYVAPGLYGDTITVTVTY